MTKEAQQTRYHLPSRWRRSPLPFQHGCFQLVAGLSCPHFGMPVSAKRKPSLVRESSGLAFAAHPDAPEGNRGGNGGGERGGQHLIGGGAGDGEEGQGEEGGGQVDRGGESPCPFWKEYQRPRPRAVTHDAPEGARARGDIRRRGQLRGRGRQ